MAGDAELLAAFERVFGRPLPDDLPRPPLSDGRDPDPVDDVEQDDAADRYFE